MSVYSEKQVKNFTDSLYELFVEQKLTLSQSLDVIAFKKKTVVQKGAAKIREDMMEGCSFSNALKSCSFLDFDQTYISFVAFSEITGNLQETLEFLKKRCERRADNLAKLADASLYPAFVVLLAIGVCVFLKYYTGAVYGAGDAGGSGGGVPGGSGGGVPVFVLLFLCGFAFWVIKKNLMENKLYEAFLAIGFLVKSGVNVSAAVGEAAGILGKDTKDGKLFLAAKEKLEFGMDIYSAFENLCIKPELKNAFYYAKKTGGKADVFEKIALKMGAEDEKRRRRYLSVVEPVFIGFTGIFLMVVLVSYLMPMMNDTSWIR